MSDPSARLRRRRPLPLAGIVAVVILVSSSAASPQPSAPRLGVEATLLMRIGALAFLVGLLLVSEWHKRRKRAELERLEALREEF